MPRSKVFGEIEAMVSFRASNDSDNSSLWDIEDFELEGLHMFGDDWTEKELRLTFGDQGAVAFMQLIFNNVGEDWEDE